MAFSGIVPSAGQDRGGSGWQVPVQLELHRVCGMESRSPRAQGRPAGGWQRLPQRPGCAYIRGANEGSYRATRGDILGRLMQVDGVLADTRAHLGMILARLTSEVLLITG